MNLTHIRLLVSDFAGCFRFYRDILGLEAAFGDENEVYTEFNAGGCILALFNKGLMADVVGTEFLPSQTLAQDKAVLTFAVDDVDAKYHELQARNVDFVNEPHDQPNWMIRVAHLRDPDGNLIEFYQPLSS